MAEPRWRRTGVCASLGALALATALAGCGTKAEPVEGSGGPQKQAISKEGPTGHDALEKARANMNSWTGVSLKGTVNDSESDMTIEASGSVKQGEDFRMKVSGETGGIDLKFEVRSVDGTMYMHGNEGFYKENLKDTDGTMARVVGDKFLEVPSSMAGDTDDLTLAGFIESMVDSDAFEDDNLEDSEAKGKLTDFQGTQAYAYQLKTDEDAFTMYLTADGSEQLAGLKYADKGVFEFKDHNKDVTIKAPSKDEVVPMDDLQRQGPKIQD